MNRRHFVRLLAGAAVVLSGSWLLIYRIGKDDEASENARVVIIIRLAEIFSDLGPVCFLGNRVLSALPETSTKRLLDDLFTHMNWPPTLVGDATDLLRAQIQRDFTIANTVIVDNWTLSKTEAAFYALTAKLSCGNG
jgi:hypothetical protein